MFLVFTLSFLPCAVHFIDHIYGLSVVFVKSHCLVYFMLQNQDIASCLEKFSPLSLAEDYDNVGLLVGEKDKEVKGVLTSLDITLAVLEEALRKGLDLVVSHHPIWFRSRRNLLGDDFVSEVILFAIRNHISLYACHTNLDNIKDGVNQGIAQALGILKPRFLLSKQWPQGKLAQPGKADKEQCAAGSGMIGELPQALSPDDFLKTVKEKFGCGCIRYAPTNKKTIQRVAFCGGAGSFLLPEALKQKADAFLTSDVTYHNFFDSRSKLLYLDIGHYESEQFSPHILAGYLQKHFPVLNIQDCQISTNPVSYYV